MIVEQVHEKNPKARSHEYMIGHTTPLHLAARWGHFEICELICKNLQDSNVTNDNGVTPLHLAAQYDRLTICQLLTKNAVDKSPMDNAGWTPFQYAVMNKNPCTEFLKSVTGHQQLTSAGDNCSVVWYYNKF